MRILRYKNHWDFNDNALMIGGTYTPVGKGAIWQSIDDSLRFNVEKKEEFMARTLIARLTQMRNNAVTTQRRVVKKRAFEEDEDEDPVRRFFEKKRTKDQGNTYLGNKFFLPRPDRCR